MLSSVLTRASSASSWSRLRRTRPMVLSPEIEPASDASGKPRRGVVVLESLALVGTALFQANYVKRMFSQKTRGGGTMTGV